MVGMRPCLNSLLTRPWEATGGQQRSFSTTPATKMRDFFPVVETKEVKLTPPAWKHPVYAKSPPAKSLKHTMCPDNSI